MSLGICGKRVGYEEIFGSSSPPPSSSSSSSKKPRRSGFGSPNRSEPISALLQMFPSLDPEVVEGVFRNNNCDVEGAIEYLGALSSVNTHGRDKSKTTDSGVTGNRLSNVDLDQAISCSRMWEETIEEEKRVISTTICGQPTNGMKWVDLFVQEMMNSKDFDDAKGRAARILEAFEKCICAQTRVSEEVQPKRVSEEEHASLKEHLQILLNDNQILKRAVAIQHERNLEQEEKTKGVEQLKDVINQYQEKVHGLQMSNYALELHLRRARENSTASGQFLPDIY